MSGEGTPRARADPEEKRRVHARLRAAALDRFGPALGFSERELALNASGRLSFRQRVSSGARGLFWAVTSLLAWAWVIEVAVTVFGPGNHRGLVGALLGIPVIVAVSGFLALRSADNWRDAVGGRAAQMLGPLRHATTKTRRGTVVDWLECGPLWFRAPDGVFGAIEPKVRYRVYYTSRTHRLLSLERAEA
ncbi:MAG TPA: hypothetical protein VMI54_02495 [Polyangiaceae bacterium]|nr:hypothetical protein [Polyangiaceae bacterium]